MGSGQAQTQRGTANARMDAKAVGTATPHAPKLALPGEKRACHGCWIVTDSECARLRALSIAEPAPRVAWPCIFSSPPPNGSLPPQAAGQKARAGARSQNGRLSCISCFRFLSPAHHALPARPGPNEFPCRIPLPLTVPCPCPLPLASRAPPRYSSLTRVNVAAGRLRQIRQTGNRACHAPATTQRVMTN